MVYIHMQGIFVSIYSTVCPIFYRHISYVSSEKERTIEGNEGWGVFSLRGLNQSLGAKTGKAVDLKGAFCLCCLLWIWLTGTARVPPALFLLLLAQSVQRQGGVPSRTWSLTILGLGKERRMGRSGRIKIALCLSQSCKQGLWQPLADVLLAHSGQP